MLSRRQSAELASIDIVIAGRNFGIGSSRPVAELSKTLGVAALVADEFNSLFYRNAINLGLPAIAIPGVSVAVPDEAPVRLDIRAATIQTVDGAVSLRGAPLPDFVYDIVA